MAGETKLRVGILFGGRSGEHEISLRSARSVVDALDRSRFDLVLIGIDRRGGWHLFSEKAFAGLRKYVPGNGASHVALVPGAAAPIDLSGSQRALPSLDVVFPVLHGPYGEDGTVQGLCEMVGLPYVGADVLASAIGMDKVVQKRLLREAGLPVTPGTVATRTRWASDPEQVRSEAAKLGMPVFVKPASLGSSLGVIKVHDASELDRAVEEALRYDWKVLIEQAIDGRELECSVLGNDTPEASIPGEIVPQDDFYSYEAKYEETSEARLLIPAPLSAQQRESVRTLAKRTFAALACCGMARVDLFLERGSGKLFVNEINTIPGFTAISMYPKLWEASGLPYPQLLTRLIELAGDRHATRQAATRPRAQPDAST